MLPSCLLLSPLAADFSRITFLMKHSPPASKDSAVSSKDLLQLEKNASVLEKRLLICTNGEDVSRRAAPMITAMPESNVLGRIKSFLPTLDEANRKLFSDIQEKGAEEFNIESVSDTEARYVEMDLALGVADLNTPEALAAAEFAANGQVLKVDNSGACSGHRCDSDSDSDEEGTISRSNITQLLNGRVKGHKISGSEDEDCATNKSQTKRKKIEFL